jgi:hypothetical protein
LRSVRKSRPGWPALGDDFVDSPALFDIVLRHFEHCPCLAGSPPPHQSPHGSRGVHCRVAAVIHCHATSDPRPVDSGVSPPQELQGLEKWSRVARRNVLTFCSGVRQLPRRPHRRTVHSQEAQNRTCGISRTVVKNLTDPLRRSVGTARIPRATPGICVALCRWQRRPIL